MKTTLLHMFLVVALLTLSCTASLAQYVTPDQVQSQREEQERQRKDGEANSYLGTTYWYVPNPDAIRRVALFSEIPQSILNERSLQFWPISETSFSVIKVDIIRNSYAILDGYYLKIRFPDDKVGYIKVDELKQHLYAGQNYGFEEYIFGKPPHQVSVDQRTSPSEGETNTTSADLLTSSPEAKAKLTPRIGMTKAQVLASRWGKPNKINRASTALGAREQWIYGNGYLYFEKGVLVAIDK